MVNKKIYFLAPLANVDLSILKIKLKYGFEIKDIPIEDYCKFISKMERATPESISTNLTRNYPRLLDCSRQKIYIIENFFNIQKVKNPINQGMILSSESQKFQSKLVQNYLQSTIKKMRLFKEGNIFIPFWYMYSKKDNNPHHLMTYSYSLLTHISHEKYTIIDERELAKLNEFINKINLPFKYPFLQLAFENFEISYHLLNQNLAFLSLMISLESLFHPEDQGELRYRISRNIAVLLGDVENNDSKIIQSEIKKLYDKRSKVVHTGIKDVIKKEDLLDLRHYVRESIKMIYTLNKSKSKLLDLLNSSGFNEELYNFNSKLIH